jgi:hypothetical protein
MADDVQFIRLMWALNAMQSGREHCIRSLIYGYPDQAISENFLEKSSIYPWELETLSNEILTISKHPYYRVFRHKFWKDSAELVNLLRNLEDSEFSEYQNDIRIQVELGRIAARQFAWQRGFVNIANIYRNVFIFGGEKCSKFFLDKNNISISNVLLVGFAIRSLFHERDIVRPIKDLQVLSRLGINYDDILNTLDIICAPIDSIRNTKQSNLPDYGQPMAYRPSILRSIPCFFTKRNKKSLICPLPDLIIDRLTNGLFYDVIGGGGPIREELGMRFEMYCYNLILNSFCDENWKKELSYSTKFGQVQTPDIMMMNNEGSITLSIECKATRMGSLALFGQNPTSDRGYEEIAKGIMQLWRFNSHCRSRVSPLKMSKNSKSLLLTRDEWFAGRSLIIKEIIDMANEMADASSHYISIEDRKPVAFCSISEFERMLSTATINSLLDTVDIAAESKIGWDLSIVHDETQAPKCTPRSYPFTSELGTLLPWFDQLGVADSE